METELLIFMEKDLRPVWFPLQLAIMFGGRRMTTKDRLYRRVLCALKKLEHDGFVSSTYSYGSNQSVYWLKSRIIVPPGIYDILF